jgi:hypothetical protein
MNRWRKPEEQLFIEREFSGLAKQRRCTDVIPLLLLLLAWAVMTAIGLSATGIVRIPSVSKGDPQRLLHGM